MTILVDRYPTTHVYFTSSLVELHHQRVEKQKLLLDLVTSNSVTCRIEEAAFFFLHYDDMMMTKK